MIRESLRLDMMPHILCPGCGHGIVLQALLRAVQRAALPREQVVFVSGIGCSSRIVGYIDGCTLHTTHGRPLTFATGLKLARPELHVVVITGDGDGLAIGGNHLIHAARRNADLTCLLLNNAIYGMTGGQGAPTTPAGSRSVTMPDGTVEPAFDACRLVAGAGGTFVARGMTASPLDLETLIVQALGHRGFSFLEVLSDCPEYFGRYNHLGHGPEMLETQRRNLSGVDELLGRKRFVAGLEPSGASARPVPAGLSFGVLHEESRPDLSELLRARADARPGPARATAPSAPARDGDAPAIGERQIRLAGAGGQGIVLAGLLLAEAAVAVGRNATHAQAYGPESRGGASKADVIVADGEIDYPYVERADILIALTQSAYDRYASEVRPDGVALVDADRVTAATTAGITVHALPLVATSERVLGTPLGANLVALGALLALTGIVPAAALEAAVAARRPGGNAERAVQAVKAGAELARSSLAVR